MKSQHRGRSKVRQNKLHGLILQNAILATLFVKDFHRPFLNKIQPIQWQIRAAAIYSA